MLFAQLNGNGQDRPVDDRTEVDVLQNIACEIGPRVDGIHAPRSLPQAMGAFVTAGAQGACAGRGQQTEQHTPTTMHGLGETLMPTTTKLAFDTGKMALLKATALPYAEMKVMATDARLLTPVAPSTPVAPAASTVPPGTITAFDASTNMWRVAVPSTTAGLGIFGATAPFTEVAPAAAPPTGATQVSPMQFAKQTGTLPFYKKWQFWAAVAGGVAVVGTGAALLFRRKRAA